MSQLGQQGVGFDEPRLALAAAVDLAVDAVEIADLVGIEIHADRNPARPAAEHRVDEPVALEQSGVIGVECKRHVITCNRILANTTFQLILYNQAKNFPERAH